MAGEIAERIERGLRIARAAECAGKVARLVAQRPAVGAENRPSRRSSARQRFMWRGSHARPRRPDASIRNRSPSVSKIARAMRRKASSPHIRLQGGLVVHVTVL